MDTPTISLLDELAANAWPTIVRQQLGGCVLRAANGVTRRANSVLTTGPAPPDLNWLPIVEDFYLRRSITVRFQISPASPPDLLPFLEQHGYAVELYTSVQIGDVRGVLEAAPTTSGHFAVQLSPVLRDEWLDSFLRLEGFPEERKATYRLMLSAIGPAACFALVREGDETLGVGLAVAERGWSGLFAVATAEVHRGRGVGTFIVRSLAEWSATMGAQSLYLQVVESNTPALNLYARLGFQTAYSYCYALRH
jgi:N-acetylglutamate synthase